jgi:hypothetical protein
MAKKATNKKMKKASPKKAAPAAKKAVQKKPAAKPPAAKAKHAPEKAKPVAPDKRPAAAPAKAAVAKAGIAKPGVAKPGAPTGAPQAAPAKPKKSSRRSTLLLRRGPDGQPLAPGELLLPGGAGSVEEIHYLFRGAIANQKIPTETMFVEVSQKKQPGDPLANRADLERHHATYWKRFHEGPIEAHLPNRGTPKKTFQGFLERARGRRREIGALLRGLDMGKTESSQMDSHGEDSLHRLMEWSARLEKLAEDAKEPAQGDYTQFHRGLDQLDHTTEALIVDVELTLRRLGGGRQK